MSPSVAVETLQSIDIDEHRYPVIDVDALRENSQYLHQMLPYDLSAKKAKDLQENLNEYRMLLQASKEALDYFIAGSYHKFDSLVGENACQIRAVQIAIMANSLQSHLTSLRERLDRVLDILDTLICPDVIHRLKSASNTIQNVLQANSLGIRISEEEAYIITSFLLSEAKDEDRIHGLLKYDYAAPQKLKKFGLISITFARNLISKLRKYLSIHSVDFIRKTAKSLNNPILEEMTGDDFTLKHINCSCIPMFWSYKTLLSYLLQNNIPIILHAKFVQRSSNEYIVYDEAFLIFKPEQQNGKIVFVEKECTQILQESPAIIVEGVVCGENKTTANSWKKRMKNFCLDDVILAGAADHRQYPNQDFDSCIDLLQDAEYENYKTMAKNCGFSYGNPSTFFINHVFASKPNDLDYLKMSI